MLVNRINLTDWFHFSYSYS